MLYKGRSYNLLQQLEPSYRGAITTPAAYSMKFNDIDFGDNAEYATDQTVNTGSVLADKRGDTDQEPSGTMTAVLCLNEIGRWLTMLLGPPVTTGTGPYTHTYTLSLNDRPSALLSIERSGATAMHRFIGVMLNTLSWQVMERDQNMALGFIPGAEVRPWPSTTFDAAPTSLATNRACTKGGYVYDVNGASTLGAITKAGVTINNDMTGHPLADDQEGFGLIELGEVGISGDLSFIYSSDTSLDAYMRNHTSVALELLSKNAAGDASLLLKLPKVEFGKWRTRIATSKGIPVDTPWMAHSDGANVPQIVLINGIVSYAA